MTYPKLTVFNFKISYYLFRIFTLFWLCEEISFYHKYSQRPAELYLPTVWFQNLFLPVFPTPLFYYSTIALTVFLLIFSLFRFSIFINIFLFLLVAYISLPVVSYRGLSHTNHVLILSYFFSIFLNPKKLQSVDYKYIQIYYLGLLSTYSLAGFWKLLSSTKDLLTSNPEISWFETNAAKYNSLLNYFVVDKNLPEWMSNIYEYQNLWIVLTVGAIILQTLCFLGAFNRKYLTFFLVFLLIFHFYTLYFVIADLRIMKYGLIVLFFPYHYFYPQIQKRFKFI